MAIKTWEEIAMMEETLRQARAELEAQETQEFVRDKFFPHVCGGLRSFVEAVRISDGEYVDYNIYINVNQLCMVQAHCPDIWAEHLAAMSTPMAFQMLNTYGQGVVSKDSDPCKALWECSQIINRLVDARSMLGMGIALQADMIVLRDRTQAALRISPTEDITRITGGVLTPEKVEEYRIICDTCLHADTLKDLAVIAPLVEWFNDTFRKFSRIKL